MRRQSLCVGSQRMTLECKYGSRGDFLSRYNPDAQRVLCKNAENCITGDYPTLVTLNNGYGANTAFAWLVPQLYNLSEFCGCKDKLQGRPLEECADVIAQEFYYLKISELMLFFYRFKTGRYGRFYGAVDPLVITTALREFLIDRASAYARHEREEQARQRMEWEKEAVSYEEYLRQKNNIDNQQ